MLLITNVNCGQFWLVTKCLVMIISHVVITWYRMYILKVIAHVEWLDLLDRKQLDRKKLKCMYDRDGVRDRGGGEYICKNRWEVQTYAHLCSHLYIICRAAALYARVTLEASWLTGRPLTQGHLSCGSAWDGEEAFGQGARAWQRDASGGYLGGGLVDGYSEGHMKITGIAACEWFSAIVIGSVISVGWLVNFEDDDLHRDRCWILSRRFTGLVVLTNEHFFPSNIMPCLWKSRRSQGISLLQIAVIPRISMSLPFPNI